MIHHYLSYMPSFIYVCMLARYSGNDKCPWVHHQRHYVSQLVFIRPHTRGSVTSAMQAVALFSCFKNYCQQGTTYFPLFLSFVVRTVCSLQERCHFFSTYNCQGSMMYLLTWCLCTWTSLISVVTLLKVTLNTEFTNTELLLQGEIQTKFLWASGYKIFIRQ